MKLTFDSQFDAGAGSTAPRNNCDGAAALHRRDAELDAELDAQLDARATVYKRVGGLLIKDVGEMVV